MKYKLVDLSLVAFFILLGGYHLFLLLNDQFDAMAVLNDGQFIDRKESPLAHITKKENLVKLKGVESMAFSETKVGAPLISNDQVYIHENSLATISFDNNGGEVSLLGNTLFKISQKDNKTEIDLDSGSLTAKLGEGASPLKLKLNGQEFEIKGENTEINISQNEKKTKISLIKGEAKIAGAGKELLSLKENESLERDRDKKSKGFEIKVFEISLVSPISGNVNYFGEDLNVNFQWKGDPRKISRILIAKDPHLDDLFYQEDIPLGSSSVNISFDEEGTYFWKIIQGEKGQKPIESSIYSFSLFKEKSINLISPADGDDVFYLEEYNEDQFLKMSWEKIDGVNLYQLKMRISSGETREFKVKGNSYNLKLTKDLIGTEVFWQVKIDVENRPYASYSDEHSFSIEEKGLPSIPELEKPAHNSEKIFYDFGNAVIDVEFGEIDEAIGYEVIILNKKDNQVMVQKIVDESSYQYKVNQSGVYGVKVRAIDPFKRKTNFSNENLVNIHLEETDLKRPEQGQKVIIKRPTDLVDFKWREKKNKKNEEIYIFEVSKDKSFSSLLMTKKIKKPEAKINIPETGVFFWRTKIVHPNNPSKTIFSKPQKVEIVPAPPPVAPEIPSKIEVEIQEAQIIKTLMKKMKLVLSHLIGIPNAYGNEQKNRKRFAKIKWKEQDDIEWYLLEIYNEDDELILSEKVKEAYFEWANPKEGRYKWRLSFIDFFKRQGPFSDFSELVITLPDELKKLDPVNLISPKHNTFYKINDTEKNEGIKFEWERDDRAHSSKFYLSRGLGFSQNEIVLEKVVDDQEVLLKFNQFKLPVKGEVSYYWKVHSYGDHKKIARSKRRKINIEIIETKRKKEKRIPKKKRVNYPLFLMGGYGFVKTEYEQKIGESKVLIKGNQSKNFSLLLEKHFKNIVILNEILYQDGVVFEDQKLATIKNNLTFGYKVPLGKTNFFAGVGLSLLRNSSFKIVNQSVKNSEALLSLGGHGGFGVESIIGKRIKNLFWGNIHLFSIEGIEIHDYIHYFFSKKYAFGLNLSYQKLETSKLQLTNSSISLNILFVL